MQPRGGASAPQGSDVKLFVSDGPEFKEIQMPDVRNMSVTEATAQLEDLKLRVRVVESCGGGGITVIDTDPVSSMTVLENQVVALFVC